MDRWACVDVPALPLQLLLRRRADWARLPVVVVDEDRPQGVILWANELARRHRIWPGRRYAEGLALAAELRAGVVSESEIMSEYEGLLRFMREFTPEVEPRGLEDPGVFWLNASGVEGLFPSVLAWAEEVAAGLRARQLLGSVVVGFGRFGTYALARSRREVAVIDTPEEERSLADRVPLHRLDLAPGLRDSLAMLGVESVGGFRRLPAGGILERFGAEAHRLHRLACGGRQEPLAPVSELVEPRSRHELAPDQHGVDMTGLLFLCKQRLAHVVRLLSSQGRAITSLSLHLSFEEDPVREECVRPADPTLDEAQLIDLLRLRLESVQLTDELVAFELSAQSVRASVSQLQLFREGPKRDLAAGNRALARLRAVLGESAVVSGRLAAGHLPEASFTWCPLPRLEVAAPTEPESPRLVRRILSRPRVLASQRAGEDGWFASGFESGPVRDLAGPFVVSGGWWHREQHRDYYFAETRRGDLLWIYYDRRRRLWCLQGAVE